MNLPKICIGDVVVADGNAIASAIGDETNSAQTYSDLVNIITSDKEALVAYLNLYGLTGQDASSSLIDLVNQLNSITATKWYQRTEADLFQDFSNSLDVLDSVEVSTNIPLSESLSEGQVVSSDYANSYDVSDNIFAYSGIIETPIMTSNSTPSGTAFASNILSSTFDAWKAFNGTTTDVNDAWKTDGTLVGSLGYQFPVATVINGYELVSLNDPSTGISSFPKDWTIEASNDDTNWIVLDTQTNQKALNYGFSSTLYSMNNTTSYIMYRINITANNGNLVYTSIGEFRLTYK